VRIQFAKNSNDTVFKISKLLNENDMLWGTTLSMQSVDMDVLDAVNRPHLGMDAYRDLKALYNRHQIPTYTELILGLPLETRDSFLDGICGLFEIGIHDDIRVFELALLPNAPISRAEERERYGLRTRIKPLRQVPAGGVQEDVELVVGTRSLPYDDWAYCLLFGEAIQALHNGGFTRFLAIHLNDRRAFSYRRFYDGFIQFLLGDERRCGDGFRRVRRLIDQFHDDPHMSQIHRLMAQPDIVAFLDSYNPRRKGWQIWTYLWLWIADHMEAFYAALADFLDAAGLEMDAELDDLLQYQQSIMITLDYDPETGKQVDCAHNWHDYFFGGVPLKEASCTLHYRDRTMGVSHRFALKAGDRIRFTRAAIGISYPYSKHLHFFHQPDTTTVTTA
jgi:putative methyltransferase